MPLSLEGKLVVALSSRALFDFEEENKVFEDANDYTYMAVDGEDVGEPRDALVGALAHA